MQNLERRITRLELTRTGACLDCEVDASSKGRLVKPCTHQRKNLAQHIQDVGRPRTEGARQ